MFILSTILNTYNDYTRRTRKSDTSKESGKEVGRFGYGLYKSCRGIEQFVRRKRSSKDNGSIRSKSKQQQSSNSQVARIRVYLSLIPLFIFYNSHLWTLLFIIDMSFADELLYINIQQINVIINTLQRFNNIGVV
jgi:hypothetical protein